ncbi:ficolin-1-like isoform X2 [Dendronephthya gigantea]|uniref:ficolin-1-like isoform X2 n=1 Tax=Dendronephthya gigantea TaxID=151771 RepID=UPI00106BBCB0|nr:ficolin-1-like isoform X2 [Dendronephthya gigantea]
MLRIALVVILFQVVLQTACTEALCCDDIRSDIKNRTLAYNLLCSKHDPQLGSCCRVIERNIRKHKLALRILCPNNETDHCKSNPCGPNAVCVSNSNHYTCTCKPGYTGPGTNCTKINYCSSNPCDVNAVCVSNTYNYTCTCKPGYTGPGTHCKVISGKSCADLYKLGVRQDGVYTINPDGLGSFKVSCDMSKDGGGWTVFQRRQDGSQDFYVGWSDYKAGFGDLNGEFWLGLDKIHRLTKSGQNVLRVDLMDFRGAKRHAKYGTFSVADESDKYRLTIGSYRSGYAGDSLDYHNQMQFTTKDNDNDAWSRNCASYHKGAWWYKNCFRSNLNGLYVDAGQINSEGINWYRWKLSYYSFKKSEMKIRPTV